MLYGIIILIAFAILWPMLCASSNAVFCSVFWGGMAAVAALILYGGFWEILPLLAVVVPIGSIGALIFLEYRHRAKAKSP